MGITYWYACAVQLLLLFSVYVIYFRRTLLSGLEPQKPLLEKPPANRLVIFAVDGLNVESFFEQRCRNVPHLKQIFLHQGLVGISRARVTNRCDTFTTLFSGCHKDVLEAVHRIPIDTIFNRSDSSHAWCSAELKENFQGDNTKKIVLDEWTFRAVKTHILIASHHMQNLTGQVFFIQAQGLNLPNLYRTYQQHLNYTQRAIWETYNIFERAFQDQRTAYLLTSRHVGSPGDNNTSNNGEVQMPFVLWGAGVANCSTQPGRSFVATEEGQRLPLHVLDAKQLVSVMSGLLGLPLPMYNRGQLPAGLLNTSFHEAHATYLNALQFVNLAQTALGRHQRGLLTKLLPSHKLSDVNIHKFVSTADSMWHQQRYITLTEYCSSFMPKLLELTDYYVHYYRQALLWASAFAFLGWVHQLRGTKAGSQSVLNLIFEALVRLVFFLLIIFVLLQRVPWLVSGILLLPTLLWSYKGVFHEEYLISYRQLIMFMLFSICCFVGFFFRSFIGLIYFGFACYHNRSAFAQRSPICVIWVLLLCALTALSWLPPALGYWQGNWLLGSLFITAVRPFICSPQQIKRRYCIFNGLVLLLAGLHVLFSSQACLLQLIARAFACYVFFPRQRRDGAKQLLFDLCTLYALLSTSYEPLVIQLLAMELQLQLRLNQDIGTGINRKSTLAMYILIYSCYSLFVIGNIDAVDQFRFYMRFTGFGFYSTLINGLLITIKILLPIFLLLCIICANCNMTWLSRRHIFCRLLIMCNFMAIIALFRIRSEIISWQDLVRVIHFFIVQGLPFLLLVLCQLAHYMLGDHRRENFQLPKWNVPIY
ncbi:GPI ethanolamine phosphate transferase 1 [Drosophila mojavensis]|uniref:GPI ethanolamine phosphate transferase 1 n=1 Tax=Drosophila mojavensis TaxID=7230 RepID=B4KE04_DROMO|nr:GPI ethanolamine phosphate transferase 1 [Drosophila mojavensis]EDW16025.1 uncharacterized protein Dmoj_GI10295 [Drosophila mojavensis]